MLVKLKLKKNGFAAVVEAKEVTAALRGWNIERQTEMRMSQNDVR